jgi:hypothetical protein
MIEVLRRDYANMSGMIFGEIPSLDEVIGSISKLERRLNESSNGTENSR